MYRENKERELRDLCAELNLDKEIGDAVFYLATVTIREFETVHKPQLKSPAQTAESLNRIEDLSRRLSAEICGLGGDEIAIGRHLVECGISIQFDPPGRLDFFLDRLPALRSVLRLCDTLLTVAGAAIAIRDQISTLKQGGRKSTQIHYAYFVMSLAQIVSTSGISPGRGGPFEQLCTAVFGAGGVGPSPVNAIRYYTKHLHPFLQEMKSASEAGNPVEGI